MLAHLLPSMDILLTIRYINPLSHLDLFSRYPITLLLFIFSPWIFGGSLPLSPSLLPTLTLSLYHIPSPKQRNLRDIRSVSNFLVLEIPFTSVDRFTSLSSLFSYSPSWNRNISFSSQLLASRKVRSTDNRNRHERVKLKWSFQPCKKNEIVWKKNRRGIDASKGSKKKEGNKKVQMVMLGRRAVAGG